MTSIYYKPNKEYHDFFLSEEGKEYYLFTQKKRKGVGDFYKGGMPLDRAINHSFGKRDTAIHRTMDKIILYIKYVEKENGIPILRKTKKKTA